ncbi:IS4 family transposase, partial [Streptomyces sp. NPDC005195]|uniref:IS4 family transposase n=1 Tax=Streptomyces sp. NPDC005195 TaxID=3154561 RepID=UPI0033AE5A92
IFAQVARPVAEPMTRGAWLAGCRLAAIDGVVREAPDSPGNREAFGVSGSGNYASAFPQVRMVTLTECGSHAHLDAEMDGIRTPEQALARRLFPRLEPDMLVLADRNFYNFAGWTAASDTGAQMLWRVSTQLRLPVLATLADGSYLSVVHDRSVRAGARQRLLETAAAGSVTDPALARIVRVVEYEVTDRGVDAERETVCLITTLLDPGRAEAARLAAAYHERWEHETGFSQIKRYLRGPAQILRSRSPDMVRQELYGYLLAHYAIVSLICRAATEADIDPDRVKFLRTVRLVRRQVADPAAFPPCPPQ